MLYYSKKTSTLRDLILNRHNIIKSDQLFILSGYIGPGPIKDFLKEDISVRVIYGMVKQDKMSLQLYKTYCQLNKKNISIFCSGVISHAKIYLWLYKGKVVYVLNGSANFSTKGLDTQYREVLHEVSMSDFEKFYAYFKLIHDTCVPIEQAKETGYVTKVKLTSHKIDDFNPKYCTTASLFGEASKINWGHAKANVNLRDSYIPIRISDLRQYPDLFPAKQSNKGLGYNDNLPIDIVWDDGKTMKGLLEGGDVQKSLDGDRYPNKISSFKSKKILGDYLRKRLRVKEGMFVTPKIFSNYGRDNITISLLSDGVYYFDFSV